MPICPHAGGVGLCEYVQHLSIFDYIAVSASLEDRIIEYVDHLHEHFTEPVRIRNGRRTIVDGPFAETKELVAGYWIWQVKSLEEAVEWVTDDPPPGESGTRPR